MTSSFTNNIDFPPLQAFPSPWSSYYNSANKHTDSTNTNCQRNHHSINAIDKNSTTGGLSIQIPQLNHYASFPVSPRAASTSATTPPLTTTTTTTSSIAPPKYPLYLKYTNYANLITEQYQHLQQKRKKNSYDYYNKELEEIDLRLPAFWSKPKVTDLNVVNGYEVTLTDPRHKQHHHQQQHYRFIHSLIHGDSSTPNEQPQRPQRTPASVRTNFPIPPQCGMYYFETRVLSLGQDGVFAVGFCTSESKLDKLPGHDKFSFGYHGVDGQLYFRSNKQTNMELPDFAVGDIIGCGINFANETLFFTKNGVLLTAAAFEHDSSCYYYPCVGLSTLGEKLTANFGQDAFLFDIAAYVKTQGAALKKETITVAASKKEPTQEKKEMNELVLSYLIHHGYIGAAKALRMNINYIYNDNNDLLTEPAKEQGHKEDFRKLIMAGHQIDTVLEKIHTHYPGLLDHHPDLFFQLKSQKFLDMFLHDSCSQQQDNPLLMTPRSSTSSSTSSSSTGATMTDYFSSSAIEEDSTLNASFASFTFGTSPSTSSSSAFASDSVHQGRNRTYSLDSIHEEDNNTQATATSSLAQQAYIPIVPKIPAAASGRRLSWAAVAASPTKEDCCSSSSSSSSPLSSGSNNMAFLGRRRRFSSFSMAFQQQYHCANHEEQDYQCYKAIQYGQHLQKEYQHQAVYIDQLMDMFTLFTCPDLTSNPWLSVSRRDVLASDLSSAIQDYQYHVKMSDLELVYRQAIVANKELAIEGDGKAALLQTV